MSTASAPSAASTQSPVPFSSSELELEQQLSQLFVELEVSRQHDDGSPFVGESSRRTLGDLELVRVTVTRGGFEVSRTAALIADSRHNHFFIGCLFSGRAVLGQHDRQSELLPTDIAVLDSSSEYRISTPAAMDALWVRVPRHRLEARLPAPRALMAQRVQGDNGTGLLTSQLLRSAFDQAGRISPAHALRLSNTILDLLALCLEPGADTAPRANALLRRVQAYIEARLDDPALTLEQVARAHSISVRYLNKLFEREGISVARWIRTRRLELCRAALEAPDNRERSISEIAYATGFGDISTFNRAFKRQFGVSPRALRG